MAIAGGFVLRAVAGGVAAPVTLSRWFMLVVTFAAVFVAAGKRGLSCGAPLGPAGQAPRVLSCYTPALQLILVASSAAALFAYGMWAFELPAVRWSSPGDR